uniref:Uncharacterized protein n=1 Tax=Chromera velia CCMP2878 TaxID=1169474 RepID=A0A0G4GTT1_9ALVE|eukprot:Cvel_23353.t1-p1 / transcript=Cvel_23353.t1 / gene=Cvel_23353 / organism=Chromera_velia_CCMP2878 / gene_product=Uncharacterized protein C4H3.03c, putative / transcript_product=Uncharacterized protein C4H3.03c, putative / location=Cvel_scaffold2396:3791-13722(-) / protein_length=1031 / sequence_SO=supercontig / SO=protein_coding / is_pseudo=false
MVGNGTLGALIDNKARYVWACPAHFGSDPIFNALLNNNSEEVGFQDVVLEGFSGSEQEYLTNTAVLVTTLYSRDGDVLEIRDFAPRFPIFNRMHSSFQFFRILTPKKGDPQITIRVRPTFNYNSTDGFQTRGAHHIRFCGPKETWRVTTNAPIAAIIDESPFLLQEKVYLILGSDESMQSPLDDVSSEFERKTSKYWQEWIAQLSLPLEYQDVLIRAAITLKLLTAEETGGLVSSLTLAIPLGEHGPPTRDERVYRIMEECLAIGVLRDYGMTEIYRRFIKFLKNVCMRPSEPQMVYAIHMMDSMPSQQATFLAGFNGCAPVILGGVGREQSGKRNPALLGLLVWALSQVFYDARLREFSTPKLFSVLEQAATDVSEAFNKWHNIFKAYDKERAAVSARGRGKDKEAASPKPEAASSPVRALQPWGVQGTHLTPMRLRPPEEEDGSIRSRSPTHSGGPASASAGAGLTAEDGAATRKLSRHAMHSISRHSGETGGDSAEAGAGVEISSGIAVETVHPSFSTGEPLNREGGLTGTQVESLSPKKNSVWLPEGILDDDLRLLNTWAVEVEDELAVLEDLRRKGLGPFSQSPPPPPTAPPAGAPESGAGGAAAPSQAGSGGASGMPFRGGQGGGWKTGGGDVAGTKAQCGGRGSPRPGEGTDGPRSSAAQESGGSSSSSSSSSTAGVWELPEDWEARGLRVHTLCSVLCWAAAERFSELAERLNSRGDKAKQWRAVADGMREAILANAVDAKRKCFTCFWRSSLTGPSLLRLAELNFVDPRDPLFVNTLAAFEEDASIVASTNYTAVLEAVREEARLCSNPTAPKGGGKEAATSGVSADKGGDGVGGRMPSPSPGSSAAPPRTPLSSSDQRQRGDGKEDDVGAMERGGRGLQNALSILRRGGEAAGGPPPGLSGAGVGGGEGGEGSGGGGGPLSVRGKTAQAVREALASRLRESATSFTTTTLLWYAEALRASGRAAEARLLFESILRCCNECGLLSQAIDLKTGSLWGNFPYSATLLGILRCGYRLSRPWTSL